MAFGGVVGGVIVAGGVFFAWLAAGFFALLFFVIALIVRKKHKIAAGILWVFTAFNLLILIGIPCVVYSFFNQPYTVTTADGEVALRSEWTDEFDECLETWDAERLDRLLTEAPDMIYYYDNNHITLLELGLYGLNVPFMQCAIDHGAIFDDPAKYERYGTCGSLDKFFRELESPPYPLEKICEDGVTTDEIIAAVQFAIDHGAKVNFEKKNGTLAHTLLDRAKQWVGQDGELSEKDRELLDLISEYTEPIE